MDNEKLTVEQSAVDRSELEYDTHRQQQITMIPGLGQTRRTCVFVCRRSCRLEI